MVDPEDMSDETARNYRRIAEQLEQSRLDTIIIFSTDHLNTFFFDNFPALSVGVSSRTSGPNDYTPGLRPTALTVPEVFAAHVRDTMIYADFDVSITQEFTLDHSWLVPLQFIRPQADIPIVPVFVNGHMPPLTTSQRAFDLGATVRAAVESWPQPWRVGVMGSGSFSLEVGGPRIAPGKNFGVPSPAWAAEVGDLLEAGDFGGLVRAATREQMAAAGNIGGELLDWIAMIGAIEQTPPDTLDLQLQFGHGYPYWSIA